MSMRINSRSQSTIDTLRAAEVNRKKSNKSMEKLSSGQRINRAADDAAGLAIAEQMGAGLRGLEQGMENIYDGLGLIQTADGGMDQMTMNLQRMRELSMTAANGTLNEGQRDAVQAEFDTLKSEVDRISASTEFNGTDLLDGSAGSVDIALGTESGGTPDVIAIDMSVNMDTASLGLSSTRVDGVDPSNALSALDEIDAALEMISSQRSSLGATSNRLMSANQGLGIAMENTFAARSRIMDTDYAVETSKLVQQQITAQANTAVQVQSRGLASTALNLLK